MSPNQLLKRRLPHPQNIPSPCPDVGRPLDCRSAPLALSPCPAGFLRDPGSAQRRWRKHHRQQCSEEDFLSLSLSLPQKENSAAFQPQPPGILWASLEGCGWPHARPLRLRLSFPPLTPPKPPSRLPVQAWLSEHLQRPPGGPAASPFQGGSVCSL